MSSSLAEQIPIEYQRVIKEIPDDQKKSFNHSFSISDRDTHHYLRLLEAIKRTMDVYSHPSRYWYFLYGRIAFVTTKYDELLEYWGTNSRRVEITPFVGRILTFQNKYDEAIEISKKAIEAVNIHDNPTLLDILMLFEAYFTLGLSYSYTRKFEQAREMVDELAKLSSKYIIKKIVSDEFFLDLVYIEHIIRGYIAFFKGQPKEMTEALQTIHTWVEDLKDPWLKGFYFNIYGISKIMFQELNAGEKALRRAFSDFEKVHDLRGYSTVGANLAVSLITKGQRKEGRKYLESVIDPLIHMKNYWLAVGNMLTLTKTYIDEKKIDDALKTIRKAEQVSTEGNISEPSIFSMFSYFYSQVGDMEKAELYLNKLRKIIKEDEDDNYEKLFLHNASAVNAMAKGDLNQADEEIKQGIEIADKSGYFNYALEMSTLRLQIITKRYLVDQSKDHLLQAFEVQKDLIPLIEMAQNDYLEAIFYLMVAYTQLAIEDQSEAQEYYDQANLIVGNNEKTAQYGELKLYDQRRSFLKRGKIQEIENPLYREFLGNWLSDDFLSIFYAMESLRLLSFLQFETTNLGQQTEDEKLPLIVFILGPGGMTLYTYKFQETGELDEVLIGGFLSALTTFSQELFGGGMLTRVDQENHVLLMERISKRNILVLIVNEETYLLRKKFKRFSSELTRMKVVDYLEEDVVLTEYDPQYQILEGLVEVIFLGEEGGNP